MEKARSGKKKKGRAFGKFASLSKVGYVPFNPNKINQDRALEVLSFSFSPPFIARLCLVLFGALSRLMDG